MAASILRTRLLLALSLAPGAVVGCSGDDEPDVGTARGEPTSSTGTPAPSQISPGYGPATVSPPVPTGAEPSTQVTVNQPSTPTQPSAGAGGSGGAAAPGAGGATASGAGGEAIPNPFTIRRPLLVGTSLRVAPVTPDSEWRLDGEATLPSGRVDEHTRDLLGRAWLKDAVEEHASVAAFARFTLGMLTHGAPPDLVAAAQRAALDEVRHTRDCLKLAAHYGTHSTGPGPLDLTDALEVPTLAQLCALTVEEGCVGETLGALLAERQAAQATEPLVKRVCKRIERDEARHAELAWRFVAWAVKKSPELAPAIGEAFRLAVERARQARIVDYGVDERAWAAHGRLTCRQASDIVRHALDEVVRPCATALLHSIATSTTQRSHARS